MNIPFENVQDPKQTPYVELCLVEVNKLNRLSVNKSVAGNKNDTVKMHASEDGNTFILTTGKTGVKLGPNAEKQQTYPIAAWTEILQKYENMRYVIVSTQEVGKKTVTVKGDYKEIANKSVRDIITKLLKEAAEAIRQSISISFDDITDERLQEGQKIVLYLTENKDKLTVKEFNDYLMELWRVIPRAMNQINRKLVRDPSQFEDKIIEEQELLDKLYQNLRGNDVISSNKDILEANGVEMRPCTDEEIAEIKELMTTERANLVRAWRVNNKASEEVYEKYKKERGFKDGEGETLLFHGSGVENWWSIIKNSLKLNPELTKPGVRICGKAFGYGIYFAAYAAKSMSYARSTRTYTSDGSTRYMGIYRVMTGNPYFIYQDPNRKTPHNWSDFHADHPDMDCCWASSGYDGSDVGLMRLNYDETIVYREDQCTIKYLLEFL